MEKYFLYAMGNSAQMCWLNLSNRYKMIDLDEFIIMTNHIHDIINIVDDVTLGAIRESTLQKQLSEINNVSFRH